MKHTLLALIVSYCFFSFFLLLVLWIFYPAIVKKGSIVSPLPDFLTVLKNNQVSTLRLFLPHIENVEAGNFSEPPIEAKSALMYEVKTGKTLFAKNLHQKLPMASLTKIMTAVIALENYKTDTEFIVQKRELIGEDSMGLTEGEEISVHDLLYGLLLPSGNDASEVLASNFPGGRDNFIAAMNKKVAALGLLNTHFTNPSGLEGDGNQYTTVYDLLVITNYALSHFPLFGQIVAIREYHIPYTKKHKEFYLENETNLLSTYPGVKGVKTGYTPEADLCLVTYLEHDEHNIIGILLGSNNRRKEMKGLLDYSLKKLGATPPPTASM